MLRWVVGALVGVIVGGNLGALRVFGDGPGGPQDGVNIEVIETHLASDDFAEREAAQKELKKISPEQIGMLRERAKATSSEEVRARLLIRVREMEEYLALHPLGFSLDLHDAPIEEVVAAVNKQAERPIFRKNDERSEKALFTLKGDRMSFGELIQQMDRQHGIYLDFRQESPAVRVTDINPRKDGYVLSEGVLLRSSVQQARSFVNNQMQDMPWLELWVLGDFDPRIRVVSYDALQLEQALDDRGTNLVTKLPPEAGRSRVLVSESVVASVRLGSPDPQAKKITQVKGKLHLTIAVETQKIVVEDAGKKVNEPIETARGKMTIVATQGQIPQFAIQPGWMNEGLPIPGDKRGTAQVNIFNAKGELLSSWALEGNGTSGMGAGAAVVEPLRMEIYVPLRTTEVSLPVELKDVPLPANRVVIPN